MHNYLQFDFISIGFEYNSGLRLALIYNVVFFGGGVLRTFGSNGNDPDSHLNWRAISLLIRACKLYSHILNVRLLLFRNICSAGWLNERQTACID